MNLSAHEAHDLNELIISCVNSITNMSMFLNQVKDQNLKGIIQKHYPLHIKDYNLKVQFATNNNATSQLQTPRMEFSQQRINQGQGTNVNDMTPRTNVQQLNDKEIATAYLLTLKRAGREYAWSAMEATNPDLRTLFENAFIMSCNHAYEVWQWMASNGYYPVESVSENFANNLSTMYKTVDQPMNNTTM